jgi:hypothetical protein
MTKNANACSAARRSSAPVQIAVIIALSATLGLAGCGVFGGSGQSSYPSSPSSGQGRNDPNPDPNAERKGIFGSNGLSLWGGGGSSEKGTGGASIGVNSFLWRASLDTVSFMPLASADPFGGVIITDWYQDPKAEGERFKITVYILDRRLRADGVKVSLFRQARDVKSGTWVDAKVDPESAIKIENAILVRARQLRVSTLEAEEND